MTNHLVIRRPQVVSRAAGRPMSWQPLTANEAAALDKNQSTGCVREPCGRQSLRAAGR